MEPLITTVNVIPNYLLEIGFTDGETVIKDMKPVISIGNLGEDLRDPEFFKKIEIVDNGYAILWPNGLEICADSLHYPIDQERKRKKTTKLEHA